MATTAGESRRTRPGLKRGHRQPRSKSTVAPWQPGLPFDAGRTRTASRFSDSRNGSRIRTAPREKRRPWLWGIVAMAAILAVAFFLSQRRDLPTATPSATNVRQGADSASPVEDAAGNLKSDKPEKPALPASDEEKTFANWSTYHSRQGGFSVYMPDRREEKQNLRSESLGVDGQGVQSQFVQLPNTSDPIDSWPAIGEVALRAMWVDGSAARSPAKLVPAGTTSTTVKIGDLSGTEFVSKQGNETHKVRVFAQGSRTIVLTAAFVGRDSANDTGLPFGEQVDRFLNSIRLDSQATNRSAMSVVGGAGDDANGRDQFEVVERYARELAGGDASEEVIRTRVSDLKAAARRAQASPEEVLALLKSAKAEAEATGVSPDLAIRAVTGTLASTAHRNK
ncbi:MAG TPA: hypothetical protein VG826_03500 [Pirellulales bacterium]|nr:hypothetical protein [Pirellulales bacterium]